MAGKYDALEAFANRQPTPAAGPATPAPTDAPASKYGALMAYGGEAPSSVPPAPAAAPSGGEAALRGGIQGATLGFGDEAAAIIDTAVSKIPGVRSFAQMFQDASLPAVDKPDVSYSERRDAYRAKNKAAQEEHPYVYGAGEIAGGLATTPLLPGGAAAKGVKLGAKAAATAAAKAGAAMGFAQGLGSSEADLTKGDFKGALSDASLSGIAGGLTGGALGYLGGRLVSKAPEKEAEALLRGLASGEGKAGRATVKAAKILDRDKEDVLATLRSDKELRHVAAKPAKEALPVFERKLNEVGSKLDPHYDALDKATGGVSVQNLVNVLDDEMATLAKDPLNEQYIKAVDDIKKSVLKSWAPHLEDEIGANKRLLEMGLTPRKEIADVMVPTRDVRKMVTRLQTRGTEVINALNPGESSKMKADMASMMKGFIDSHLDIAAETGPVAAKAADEIRKINPTYSALANMTTAIEQRGWKESTGAMSAGGHVSNLLKHGGAIAAVPMALHGNIPGAAAALLAPHVLPLAARATRAVNSGVAGAVRNAAGGGADAEVARRILGLIQQGIPRATAIQMARSAAPGGEINEQYHQLRGE